VSTIEKLPVVVDALLDLERDRNGRTKGPLFASVDVPFAISAGTVRAGDWPSSVADWLVLEGRYGIAPGEDLDAARRELEDAIAAAASTDTWLAEHPPVVEWWGGRYLPGHTDLDEPIVAVVGDALTATSDRAVELRGMPYGCDMGLTTRVGGIPTVVFGPGDVRNAHAPNEYVPIVDLVDSCRALALTIVRFCGAA
jgi:acetylornithine deacetylase